MGELFLELTVANIQDLERQREVSFFVDTGATRAGIPQEIADQLGIAQIGTVAGNVVIGPPKSEPLAGTHLLQDFRLILDLEHHTISRSRAMRAK